MLSRGHAPVRVEVHYLDQSSYIELEKAEVDQWIEDKAAFVGQPVRDGEQAHVIGGHIELNLREEGITL